MCKGLRVLAAAAWALACGWTETVFAEDGCTAWAAELVSAQGRVEVRQAGETVWRPVAVGERLCDGDSLHVAEAARAAVRLPSETVLRLDQDTTLTFTAAARRERSLLELLRGAVHTLTRVPRTLEIRTPFVNAAVEGTEFLVRATDTEAQVTVFEGRVRMENTAGTLRLTQGESGAARAGQAPVSRIVVEPRDAVKWAVHYPPVADIARADGPPAVREAAARFAAGDLPGALEAVDEVSGGAPEAGVFAYRASLLLYVGRVEAAEAAIARALALAPDHGLALALKAVIALSRNDVAQALRLAREAVGQAPASAAPYIALSYVHQAGLDLEAALRAAEAAVERAPENALARARVAELLLVLGDLKAAEAAAEAAVQRNPNLSRIQTVLGYAYLLRLRPEPARRHFETAIARDSADPLPRLGLGLARIRQGALAEGREQIEIAAALDPTESVVRSYLGKAYFEERREALAASQYALAKTLDPRDPTPWFYDAVLKQAANRPVEALKDVDNSIKLNRGRAVYRSQFMLDSDHAARAAGLARIFEDLGFTRQAELLASASLAHDPAEHSAHRFLAEVYRNRPRYEVARVSEALQSRLLQPVSMDPLPPHMQEANLNTLGQSGPARAGLNEYTSMFSGNGLRLSASVMGGDNATLVDEVVLSAVDGPFSMALGQLHYETDGFRDDNDVTHDVYNAYVQLAVTDTLDVQAEYRTRETEQGDLRLSVDPDFVPEERRSLDQDSARFGLHWRLTPRSNFVLSYMEGTREGKAVVEAVSSPFQVDDRLDDESRDLQALYLYRFDRGSLTLGAAVGEIDREAVTEVSIPSIPFKFPPEIQSGTIDQRGAFAYFNLRYPETAVVTLGASYDTVEHEGIGLDEDRINPKFGLVWNLAPAVTLRMAAAGTLKRVLTSNQTLEPTQVAGFNQFFDDHNGTRARLYGLGLEHRLGRGGSAGIEYTTRDLEVPQLANGVLINEDRDEDVFRAYAYLTLGSNWALGAEYWVESYEKERTGVGQPTDLDMKTLPLTVRYFSPSGLFVHARASYVSQDVDMETRSGSFERFDKGFTIVDLTLGYRLPHRLGAFTLQVNNLFDKDFVYQDLSYWSADLFNFDPRYVPERTVLARLAFNF